MTNHKRAVVTGVLVTALAAVTAACGGERAPAPRPARRRRPSRSRSHVHTFGGGENFGYDAAVEKWNAEHPNIQIKYSNLTDRFEDVYLPQLLQRLQAGSGAGDVIGIDEGAMGLMAKARPQFFTDLGEYGLTGPQGRLPRRGSGRRRQRRRQAVRARHRHRRHDDVLPQGPVREGRPAHRPRGGRASSGRTGTPISRPARSSRRRRQGRQVRRRPEHPLQRDPVAGGAEERQRLLLRQEQQARHRDQPGGQDGLRLGQQLQRGRA